MRLYKVQRRKVKLYIIFLDSACPNSYTTKKWWIKSKKSWWPDPYFDVHCVDILESTSVELRKIRALLKKMVHPPKLTGFSGFYWRMVPQYG